MMKNKIRRFMALLLAAIVSTASVQVSAYAETELTDEADIILSEEIEEDICSGKTVSENEYDGSEETETDETLSGTYSCDEADTEDDLYLFEGFLRQQAGLENEKDEISNDGVARKERLSKINLELYNELASKIKAVASGNLASTDFEGVYMEPGQFITDGSNGFYSAEELGVASIEPSTNTVMRAYLDKVGFDNEALAQALIADFPYELYWYDKTYKNVETNEGAFSYNCGGMAVYDDRTGVKKIGYNITFMFAMRVAKAYSASGQTGTYSVNTGLTSWAGSVVDNARSVVDVNKDKSDYEKLKAYKDWICKEVSYNNPAADAGGPYGDPWQIIYVFDNDPSTNVVCEGYSKAFKFLCDLSDFTDQNMDCYLMSGTMEGGTGAGNHMWNNMLMDDGEYYLIDVTNCDGGTIGEPDKLFLRGRDGTAGRAENTFYVMCGSTKITYAYSDKIRNTFSKAERTISETDYDPNWGTPPDPSLCDHAKVSIVNAREASCTEPGYSGDTVCQKCGATILSGYSIPALGHDMGTGRLVKEATTYGEGRLEYRCLRPGCGHVETQVIPRKGRVESAEEDSLIKDTSSGGGRIDEQTSYYGDGNTVTTVRAGGDEISRTVYNEETGSTDKDTRIWFGGLEASYAYTGQAIKPSINVYDGVKKLTEKTDYTVKYGKNTDAGSNAFVTVTFKGNYKGTRTQRFRFTIRPAALESDFEIPDISVPAKGNTGREKNQKPAPMIIFRSTGKPLDKKMYRVTYKKDGSSLNGVSSPGTYEMEIKSAGRNVNGTAHARVTVIASGSEGRRLNLDKGRVVFTSSARRQLWTGRPIELTYGTDFTVRAGGYDVPAYCVNVTYLNNEDPGKAAVIISAIEGNPEGYTGSVRGNFTIRQGRPLSGNGFDGFSYSYTPVVEYVNGKTTLTDLVIWDNGKILRNGIDYKVRYSSNRSVTSGSTACATVTGRGNYRGSQRLYFTIAPRSLKASGLNISADDLTGNKNVTGVKVTATDVNGKKLKKNRDYRINTAAITGPDENGCCTVTVDGCGNYKDSVTLRFRKLKSASQLNKVSFKEITGKKYTGSPVTLTKDELNRLLYTGSKSSPRYLTYGKDFVVVGYVKNTEPGTAKLTVKGAGSYTGTKTISFKINQKRGSYRGALIGGTWR